MDEAIQKDAGPWLAQYDFRTKQKYIFRTNKLKEIVGASALITCMYDLFINDLASNGIQVEKNYSFPACNQTGSWSYKINRFIDLKYENQKEPFDVVVDESNGKLNGKFDGKALYVGGGNLYILWKDKQTAITANRLLCKLLREKGYSLFPACGLIHYTGKYDNDIRKLSDAFNRSKEELPPFMPMAVLPFTRVDRQTSFPVSRFETNADHAQEYLPEECWLKRKVNDERIIVTDAKDPLGVSELDEMTEKGTNSLLAVIHIDGNNMGERVSNTMSAHTNEPLQDYGAAAEKIRIFSNSIQENLVTKPLEAISEWLKDHQKRARIIVAGGDDVTLVCSAKIAFELVSEYFDTLIKNNENKIKEGNMDIDTACAGMCIFHSHSPFATAYEIAEECCDNAKKANRRNGSKNMLLDFQYCFSGVTGDLDSMREADESLMGRPYSFWSENAPNLNTAEKLKYCAAACRSIGRGNIKQLSALLLMDREQEFQLEIQRLKTIVPGEKAKSFLDELKEEQARKYLFDIAQVFDLWFREEVKPDELDQH